MATSKKSKEPSEIKNYVVIGHRLDHDGEAYFNGDPIALDATAAKPLIDAKVVEPAKD